MNYLHTDFLNIRLLMESGGLVLWLILFASVLMWTLIVERYLFVYKVHPQQQVQAVNQWLQRKDRSSWFALQIRQAVLARADAGLKRYLILIRTLTIVLPMLGLLGTVAGMIQTFDVLTVFGSSNVRGLAGGISVALITTMAGLLTALSGLYFSSQLAKKVQHDLEVMSEQLRRD